MQGSAIDYESKQGMQRNVSKNSSLQQLKLRVARQQAAPAEDVSVVSDRLQIGCHSISS